MTYFTFVKPSGVFVPDTSELLVQVENEYKAAFGNDLVVTPDTPQGVLIAAEVLAREGTLKNVATIANQINPNVAEGVFLDAIWALTGGRRIPATKTTVENVLLTGLGGAIIPSGSLARSSATGEEYALVQNVVLDPAGNGTGTFQAVNTGQIVCAANTLTDIVTGVIGWLTVNNPAEQTYLGTALESDEQSRARRRNTLAVQGVTPSEAIVSGLYELAGVKSVAYRENVTNAPVVIDGINLVAHSIWACVDGGTDDEVATTLLAKKSCGSDWNGATVINVTDPFSGQVYPVQFDRPTDIPCAVNVSVRVQGAVADPIGTVKQAIVDYANGLLNSETGLTLGIPVSAFELAGAINFASPQIFVSALEVAYISNMIFTSLLAIGLKEKATIDPTDIAVALL